MQNILYFILNILILLFVSIMLFLTNFHILILTFYLVFLFFEFIFFNLNLLKYFILVTIVYIICWLINVFDFVFIPQVLSILGANPIELLFEGHQWGPRYLVAYPAVYFSEHFEISLNTSYTFYCMIILALIVIYFVKIGDFFEDRYSKSKNAFFIVSIVSTIILSLVMNGRLIPAYFGLVLILYQQIKVFKTNTSFSASNYMIMFFGFLLSTTSSGTMMVCLLQIFLVTITIILYRGRIVIPISKFLIINTLIYGAIFGPYILKMINKNLTYYGGGLLGLINMLSHGFGIIVLEYPVVLLVLIISIPFIYFFIIYLQFGISIEIKLIVYSVVICIVCGLFGISTATMIIPILILISSLIFTNSYMKILNVFQYKRMNNPSEIKNNI